jgi:hypothetical protein
MMKQHPVVSVWHSAGLPEHGRVDCSYVIDRLLRRPLPGDFNSSCFMEYGPEWDSNMKVTKREIKLSAR